MKLPELPPGYSVGECAPGDWALVVRGRHFDGLDDPLETREDAVAAAWRVWEHESCDKAWSDLARRLRA